MRKLSLFIAAFFAACSAAIPAVQPTSGTEDYPLDALNQKQQGVVLVDLTFGADGKPTNCTVLVNPNSSSLSDATCKLLLARARFTPAVDANGKPTDSHARAKITWMIPLCKAPKQDDPRLNDPVAAQMAISSITHC